MLTRTIGWARLALKQQVEIFGGAQVSLDGLWRAAGSPPGHDPRRWQALAAPFLSGFAAYARQLDGRRAVDADSSRLIWTWDDESKDPWLHGDLMSEEFVAAAYATYLDTYSDRPTRGASDSPLVVIERS
jgi:hypothetical protein